MCCFESLNRPALGQECKVLSNNDDLGQFYRIGLLCEFCKEYFYKIGSCVGYNYAHWIEIHTKPPFGRITIQKRETHPLPRRGRALCLPSWISVNVFPGQAQGSAVRKGEIPE